MTVDTAIIQALLADVTVVGFVGTGVWPGSKPQAASNPAIVVNWIEGNPVYTNDGDSGLSQSRLEVDCWGDTYSEVKDLAAAVKNVLSGFQGTVAGISIETAEIESERDSREGGSNVDEYLHRTNIDLTVWHRQEGS